MKLKFFTLVLIITLAVNGCGGFWGLRGNGKVRSESRSISEFTKLEAGGAFTILVKSGVSSSLKIYAEENLLPVIRTQVKGNRLVIDTKKNISPRKEIKIEITTTDLESIDCSGANNVKAEGINTELFDCELSGAGNIYLSGNVKRLNAEISGAGNIDAKNLKSERVYIAVSGAASASVYASEFLDAAVSGVGSIDYYGNPANTNTNVSGVGSISRK